MKKVTSDFLLYRYSCFKVCAQHRFWKVMCLKNPEAIKQSKREMIETVHALILYFRRNVWSKLEDLFTRKMSDVFTKENLVIDPHTQKLPEYHPLYLRYHKKTVSYFSSWKVFFFDQRKNPTYTFEEVINRRYHFFRFHIFLVVINR